MSPHCGTRSGAGRSASRTEWIRTRSWRQPVSTSSVWPATRPPRTTTAPPPTGTTSLASSATGESAERPSRARRLRRADDHLGLVVLRLGRGALRRGITEDRLHRRPDLVLVEPLEMLLR